MEVLYAALFANSSTSGEQLGESATLMVGGSEKLQVYSRLGGGSGAGAEDEDESKSIMLGTPFGHRYENDPGANSSAAGHRVNYN